MIPAYIAGPFTGQTPEAIAENVRRAVNLARWATDRGYAPECVHTSIAAGCYGDDANPEDRERGLRICEARVTMTAKASGALFAIFRDEPGPDGNPLSPVALPELLVLGWYALDITIPGKKPEWLTLNRAPVGGRGVQLDLLLGVG